jgi:hypothetical protein
LLENIIKRAAMNYKITLNYLLTLCIISFTSNNLLASTEIWQDTQETSRKRKRESEPSVSVKKSRTETEDLEKHLSSEESSSITAPIQSFESFEDYANQMAEKGLPLTLIAGCGHGPHYGHAHLNSWCINLEADPSLRGFKHNTPEIFKPAVQADEILDISTHAHGVNRKNARDQIPYKNVFDVIVLERPLPETINKPWTLWNVAHMLKPGGQLIIDSCDGYRSERYAITDENLFRPACEEDTSSNAVKKQYNLFQTDLLASNHLACLKESNVKTFDLSAIEVLGRNPSFYGESFDVTPIAKKIALFGVQQNQRIKVNYDMTALGNYLARWFFTDIINIRDAYQPYTINPGQPLETARKTHILAATKTQETEEALDGWREKIRSIRGHILWK